MKDDLIEEIIKLTAEKYVYPYVNAIVKLRRINYNHNTYYNSYILELNYNNFYVRYELKYPYLYRRTYIMRVVSDLCIELSRLTNRERNYFYKRSDN